MTLKLPLTLRLLLFNVLVLFLPVATLLYLDTYERQLLSMQESAMVQQGRILSAALKDRPVEEGQSIINNLEQRSAARIRILDQQGKLVADSARDEIFPESGEDPMGDQPSAIDWNDPIYNSLTDPPAQDSLIYQTYSAIYRFYRNNLIEPEEEMDSGKFYSGKDVLLGEEVLAALEGRYGAITRVSRDQISVNLYSALPVFNEGLVSGVVLVSQSTLRILGDLYKLRLDILRIFSLSLVLSLAISLLLSIQITRPIVRLSRQAETVLDPHGQFTGHFPVFRRRDELGDLSRSLQTLSLRLENKIRFIDSMTADLVHELKNPLSSLASSMELLEQEKKLPFVASMNAQIHRMDELLNRLRELTCIEQRIDQEEREILDFREYLPLFISFHIPWAEEGLEIDFTGEKPMFLQIRGERLTQILINLLENARSFSPEDEKVFLQVNPELHQISVIDKGPGVPQGNRSRLFERFFSDRVDRGNHSGLGLSIVSAVIQGYKGTVEYSDNPEGGACFTLTFPAVKKK